jgi:mannose-1-phosphate guanylyltransferase/mannose-6-phosphate isomerase
MFNDCIIMAGGSGTRLWPASNSKTPKQFLAGPGGMSFFASAVERALAVIDRNGQVIIIAGKAHVAPIAAACAAFPEADRRRLLLIPEPAARNTAPAIACGVLYAGLVSGADRNMLVLTSDHVIGPLDAFTAAAEAASVFSRERNLAVFGIPPRSPETGYGYIEAGDVLTAAGSRVYRAAAFREKPDRATAERFLKAGNFYWNSGMFAFSSAFILEEFRRNAPEALTPLEALTAPGADAYTSQQGLRILSSWPGLEAAYQAVTGVSIDYAIAEKCGSTVMVAADFDWFDVGSWDEYTKLAADQRAEVYSHEAAHCFVDADIPVALCGTEDLIVVVRSGKDGGPASVLIAKKGTTQGVKTIVEQIKAAGRTELL